MTKVEKNETERQAELQDAREEVKQAQDALKAAAVAKKAGVDISSIVPPRAKFDGSWRIIRLSEECKKKKIDFIVNIANGVATTQLGTGKASPAGDFTYTAKPTDGGIVTFTGKMSGTTGSGKALFRRPETGFSCSGTSTMTKLD